MYFYFSPSTDPTYNLALEEYFLKHSEKNILFCYVNAPSVVVGRFQVPYREIDVALMHEMQINLVRRLSGGGTVFHDAGNLNYAFIYNCDEQEGDAYDFFNTQTLAILESLGLAHLGFERNNIFCNGKKISGVAQYKRGKRMVHHGTLLVEADLATLRRLFTHKDYYHSKGIASVSSSVANISEFVPVSVEQSILAFANACEGNLEMSIDQAYVLGQSRQYSEKEWFLGRSPAYSLKRNGLELEVKKGKLINISDSSLSCLIGQYHDYSVLSELIKNENINVEIDELF